MIKKVMNFITDEVWTVDLRKYPRILAFFIRQLRIILMAMRGFKENKIQLRASALTYYTMMSIVPVAAMIFGISKGFGFERKLEAMIREQLSEREEMKEVINYIISFANSMLENINGGFIAGVGLVLLFWSIMKVLGNIENSFNAIWRIKKSRPFVRKFSDYLSMMLIAPVLLVLSSTITVFLSNAVTGEDTFMQYVGPVINFLASLIPYLLIFLLFTILYVIMPNTKVIFRNALYGGIIAGAIFQLTQWAYIYFQVGVSKYGAIYTSFAALPLFLIWLQLSWLIVLLGAEISYAYQNIEKYEFEAEALKISNYNRRLLTFLILHQVVKGFMTGDQPLTARDIGHNLGIPMRLVRDIIFSLTENNLLAETTTESPKESAYLPSIDISQLSISYIINKLEMTEGDRLFAEESGDLKAFSGIQQDILKAIEKSPANRLIKDV
ncbi:MAG: YihY/virulence factor BrkB family protein [Bacteroidales bacterium]|nr:YihY/virulence factor BrkB family protein [Bacteroidales bacterium]